ncbi:MAG: DUF2017 family protein [Actinomycetota bacterium]|nr:DUF2017 family protein [Actinomycetota bacterium]
MSRFSRTTGGIEIELEDTEVAILSRLSSLLGAVGVDKNDPARSRLNPKIYADDGRASREFERLVGKERDEARSADRERFTDTLQAVAAGTIVLTDRDAAVWLRVLGEARIVLSARKGLFDTGLPTEPPTDPEIALVMLLGYLQEELVGEMLAAMEDRP